jgi:hypothetical protein
VFDPSSHIAQTPYSMWMRDFTGNVNWLAVSPGPDPWFANTGAREAMVYPGERFGINGPIPCIRLKVQRNATQDLNLLDQAAKVLGKARVVNELTAAVPVGLWEDPPEGVKRLPPHEWTSAAFVRSMEPNLEQRKTLDPLWWEQVREFARTRAAEVARG